MSGRFLHRAFAALFVLAGSTAAHAQTQREIAITFDDLPVASAGFADDVATQRAITARLVAAITRHHIPAIGFVNEGKLAPGGHVDAARVALLQQWIDAGLDLGNHSYSHLDLHTTPLAAYTADVARGDSVTRALLAAAHRPPPAWFRHPFLHTGRDSATRATFEAWLASSGYRVAPVTIDNSDYVFAAAYERLATRRDSFAMRRVADEYLRYMTAVVAYYERQAQALVGRDIRQVLLIHASALNADHLDDLARMLEGGGYRFVPLARAVDDSAYRSRDTYVGPAGITWIHRWALTQGKRGGFFAGEPTVPPFIERLAAGRDSTR